MSGRWRRIGQFLANVYVVAQAHPFTIVLDDISSPCNAGSILRTAELANCTVVACGITPRPPDPVVLKAASGAAEKVQMRQFLSALDAINTLKAEGYTIWAAEKTAGATIHSQQPVPNKLALVVGNEFTGVHPDAIASAHTKVYIPLEGNMNVALATHIIASDALTRAAWCKSDDHLCSPMALFQKPLASDPSNAYAWNNLGAIAGAGSVGGKYYGRTECFQMALALQPTAPEMWSNLGDCGGGTLDGMQYTVKECQERVLKLHPSEAFAWNTLGTIGGGLVDGKHFTQRECFENALTLNPLNHAVWNNLGFLGGFSVDEKRYSAEACVEKAVRLRPADPSLWRSLGKLGGGTVDGKEYSERECLDRAQQL